MKFLTQKEVTLKQAGYLVNSTNNESPIINEEFVQAQEVAHYFVTLADRIKDKNFKVETPDSFDEICLQVSMENFAATKPKYVEDGEEPKTAIKDKLVKESLAWLKFRENKSKNELINNKMQAFNVLKEFEEFGLFFSEGVVKLEKIYTVAEILKAVTLIIEKTEN